MKEGAKEVYRRYRTINTDDIHHTSMICDTIKSSIGVILKIPEEERPPVAVTWNDDSDYVGFIVPVSRFLEHEEIYELGEQLNCNEICCTYKPLDDCEGITLEFIFRYKELEDELWKETKDRWEWIRSR